MRKLVLAAPVLCLLAACSNPVGAVNTGLATANAACQTAKATTSGGAANTTAEICNPVATAVANEGLIDTVVSYGDALYESIVGTNAPATATPAASTAPAATN